jgi:alpha-beta hydrolase superfamily lysophospholipase
MAADNVSEFRIGVPSRGDLVGWELGGPNASRGVGILPGLGDHAGRYAPVGAALASRGFAAQALDLPGHGKSYGTRGHVDSWNEYRAAVTLWMDRAAMASPARRWSLIGQSMGAFVALDWAMANPARVERLVLCAPPFQLAFRPSLLKVKAAQLLVRVWPGFSQGNMILPSMLSHDPEVVREHAMDPLVHYRITARLFLEFQAMRSSLRKRGRELSTPTLLLQGGDDPITAPEGSERWAGSARSGVVTLHLYPGLYHEILKEVGREKIIGSMIDWLEGVPDR